MSTQYITHGVVYLLSTKLLAVACMYKRGGRKEKGNEGEERRGGEGIRGEGVGGGRREGEGGWGGRMGINEREGERFISFENPSLVFGFHFGMKVPMTW